MSIDDYVREAKQGLNNFPFNLPGGRYYRQLEQAKEAVEKGLLRKERVERIFAKKSSLFHALAEVVDESGFDVVAYFQRYGDGITDAPELFELYAKMRERGYSRQELIC